MIRVTNWRHERHANWLDLFDGRAPFGGHFSIAASSGLGANAAGGRGGHPRLGDGLSFERQLLGREHDPYRRPQTDQPRTVAHAAAAFLNALARHRAATASSTRPLPASPGGKAAGRMETADLLAALLAFQCRPSLGGVGQLLVGQAYKELGMPEQMAKVFEAAIPTVPPAAAQEMSYCLAEQHWADGKREPALKLLTALATSGQGKWGRAARLRLASIALSDGQAQQCLTACTALLHDNDAVDRPVVLRLMGTAYEQLGEFQNAAKCFAGEAGIGRSCGLRLPRSQAPPGNALALRLRLIGQQMPGRAWRARRQLGEMGNLQIPHIWQNR